MTFPDLVGIFGVICAHGAYAGLLLGRLQRSDPRYIGLNILGPSCILFSLVFHFNLAAVIAQILWIGMTTIGWVKAARLRHKPTPRAARDCMRT